MKKHGREVLGKCRGPGCGREVYRCRVEINDGCKFCEALTCTPECFKRLDEVPQAAAPMDDNTYVGVGGDFTFPGSSTTTGTSTGDGGYSFQTTGGWQNPGFEITYGDGKREGFVSESVAFRGNKNAGRRGFMRGFVSGIAATSVLAGLLNWL